MFRNLKEKPRKEREKILFVSLIIATLILILLLIFTFRIEKGEKGQSLQEGLRSFFGGLRS